MTTLRCGAIALALLSPALSASSAVPSPFTASFEVVPRLDCATRRGSGVRLSENLIISVAHVTNNETCSAFGIPIKQTRIEPGRDVSFAEGDLGDGFRAIYSCEGIHEGQRYLAMGYAFGGAPNVEILVGTKARASAGQSIMHGKVYHGMSGGGVFTEFGTLVAVINAMNTEAPLSFVTPLSETYLCKGSSK